MSEKKKADHDKDPSMIDQIEGGVKKSARVLRKGMPRLSKIVRKSDDPLEAKEHTKDEMDDVAGDFIREQFENHLQSQVGKMKENLQEKADANAEKAHSNAEEAKQKVQDRLLKLRERMSSLKESGSELQESLNNNNQSGNRIKGVQDIKGVSNIKSASQIKGPKDVKGLSDIKTYHS